MPYEFLRRGCVLAGAIVIVLGVVALPVSAAAQDPPKIDLAAGYSLLHDNDLSENFPMGWFVSVGGTLSPMLAVVGEASGNYKTVTPLPGVDVSTKVHTFMGGPKLYVRQGSVTPWGQVLVGAATASASAYGVSDSNTNFAIQPGGGVDIDVKEMFGVRVGANMRFIRSSGATSREFQVVAGIVIRP